MILHPMLASVVDEGCGDLILVTGSLFPVFVFDFANHPGRAALQVVVIIATLLIVWRATRGGWWLLRLPCLAFAYGCSNLAVVFIVAALSFGTEPSFRLLCPVLALGLALMVAAAVLVVRLTIPRGSRPARLEGSGRHS